MIQARPLHARVEAASQRRVLLMLAAMLGAIGVAIASPRAHAAADITYVSTAGTDNPDCSAAAPCRTINAALSSTNAGGQVILTTSGPYDAATITQAVSIVAPADVYAIVNAFGAPAITVNAPGANVLLRGIAVANQALGTVGVNVLAAQQLNIENVSIYGFDRRGTRGLSVKPGSAVNITLSRCQFRNDATALYFQGTPDAPVTAVVRDAVVTGGSIGIDVREDASAVVFDTAVSGTDNTGVNVQPTVAGRFARLSLYRVSVAHIDGTAMYVGDDAGISITNVNASRIEFSQTGLRAGTLSTTRLMGSTIAENIVGVDYAPGALVESIGNNVIRGNRANGDNPQYFSPQ